MGFVKQQLETVKRKRAANVSERSVLYNQQLRRYLKMRKEAKDRPVKVQLSNGAQLLNKTVETGVQVRPGRDEPKEMSVLFAGEDEEIEVPTPIRPGNSRSPRTNKKAAKQQEINEKKDHLLAIIMSDPQSFGATDRGKILNPKTGREFIDSDLNWSIERLVDPRPENAPSPSGTKELMRKLAQNPLATVKKKHPKLKRTEFDDFLQRNTTYTLFKPKREKFQRLRTVPTGFMTDVQADLADFQALSRKNSGYRYLLLAVDVLSRRMFGSPVKSKKPADVKRAFEEVFGQMPKLPETLYTDRGLEFVAKPMKEFFAENGIKKYETSSKKKAAVAERAIRTLKTRLYKYFSAKNTSAWVDVLPKFLAAINNSVCRATGLRPNDITDANAREASRIKPNPGLRYIAKLCLNSLWGRFALRNRLTKTEIVDNYADLGKLLNDEKIDISSLDQLTDRFWMVCYKTKDEHVVEHDTSNIVIALWTTSAARLHLLESMQQVYCTEDRVQRYDTRLAYTDTDSIFYEHCNDLSDPLPGGPQLGELTDEYPTTPSLTGPKAYSLCFRDNVTGELKYKMKCRGITLDSNACARISHEKMKKMVLDNWGAPDNNVVFDYETNFRITKKGDILTVPITVNKFTRNHGASVVGFWVQLI
ncbi:hypothetical protein niasHT_013848 [Heterodera trifolii]|uniref:DNA-directed DNA polymerase n=1 Tax=Heterodera trifolii TaxID=157864 RepID=A0ABD2LF21_9BILA